MKKSRDTAETRKSIAGRIYPAAGLTVFIIMWETLVRLQNVPEYRLPAPSVIAAEFVDKFPLLMTHAGVTVAESVIGFVLLTGNDFIAAAEVAELVAERNMDVERQRALRVARDSLLKIRFAESIGELQRSWV